MAIAVRGSSVAEAGSGVVVVTKPTGVVDGDYLIVYGALNSGGTIDNAPAGWTSLRNDTEFSSYVKRASSEPASWTWTLSGFVGGTFVCVAYSGVDTTTAQDVAFTETVRLQTAAVEIPGATTVTNNAWFVALVMQSTGSGGTWTDPSGFTRDVAALPSTYSNSVLAAHKAFPTAGATGSATWTSPDAPNFKKGLGVFLRPAAGDSTPPAVADRFVDSASTVTIVYDEALDPASLPNPGQYTFKRTRGGVEATVTVTTTSLATGNTRVLLGLAAPLQASDTNLRLTYSKT